MSFMSALSVDILAFFMTETEGPTQVTKTNLQRLLISSPVWKQKDLGEIIFSSQR